MSPHSLETRVTSTVLSLSDYADGTRASELTSLGYDSLDRLELAMQLEQQFEIEIPEGRPYDWVTVGDVIHTVESLAPKGLS